MLNPKLQMYVVSNPTGLNNTFIYDKTNCSTESTEQSEPLKTSQIFSKQGSYF